MVDERILVCLAQNEINTENFGNDDFENGKPFFDWFWENILGLDSEEYRRRFWREAYATGHTIGHVPRGLDDFMYEHGFVGSARSGALFMVLCLMGCSFAFWVVRRQLTLVLRRMRRSSYYERERERRRRLAEERLAVSVRRTPNRAPTVDELREAFTHAAESPEASLRFGAMLQDLECYVDNHVLVDPDTGEVRGRCGGIKRFLEREAHDLFVRYKTVMSHKARAKRFRQASDTIDPIPVDTLLPVRRSTAPAEGNMAGPVPGPPIGGGRTFRGMEFPACPALRDLSALSGWMASNGNAAYLRTLPWVRDPVGEYGEDNLLRDDSQNLAAEMLSFCGAVGTLVSLDAAIALKIDPRLVPLDVGPDARVKVLAHGMRPDNRGSRSAGTSSRIVGWLERHRKRVPAA